MYIMENSTKNTSEKIIFWLFSELGIRKIWFFRIREIFYELL